MTLPDFQVNRASFPLTELRKHRGRWVAFSSTGQQIIASHEDLGALNDLVVAAGEDPEKVALERIEDGDDVYLGGAELS